MKADELQLTKHAEDMLRERDIPEDWVWETLDAPDRENVGADNNTHYFKSIEEYGGRFLHVVVNPRVSPKRIITVFFDRKARREE